MQRFPIDLEVYFIADFTKCVVSTVKLNDEWAIEFVANFLELDRYFANSIKFIRKNTTNELIISGELIIFKDGCRIWQQKFSQLWETGSTFTDIYNHSNPLVLRKVQYTLRGILNITAKDKKCATYLTNGESTKAIQLKSLVKLLKDLELLLDPNRASFADVTLKCGGVSIPAHKNILSARSPVFAAMFAQPMKESSENEVDITDIDVPILRDLLTYMYTGKTSDLTASSAADLLFAADKYQLQDLKSVCSDFLKEKVSLRNVLSFLVVGDMLDEDLKSITMDFICNKCSEFSVLENTEEWKTLRKENPTLVMDVLTSLVKFMNGKLRS